MQKNLLDYTVSELEEIAARYNQKPYRAAQLFKWLHQAEDYNQMSDLPKDFVGKLSSDGFFAQSVGIDQALTSVDKTQKYLFKLNDGCLVEGVFLPNNYGNTLCVSTQAGCRMGCAFCASTIDGLERNLSAGEIVGQVAVANAKNGGNIKKRAIANIVLMGSGEPLDNYENVAKFIRLVTDSRGLNFSQRSISLSTCGLPDGIRALADDGFSVTLSISLHATTDENRRKIMPIAKKYSIANVVDAAEYYFNKTGRRVLLEYSLISNINMSQADAENLAKITSRFPCHVNLIMLNANERNSLAPCSMPQAVAFCKTLASKKISATIRRSLGSDIAGACGQLRRKFVGTKED